MTVVGAPERARTHLLERLHAAHERLGWLPAEAVAAVASEVRMPVAEAWEAATSYPDFRFTAPTAAAQVCTGLSCLAQGAAVGEDEQSVGCRFQCYAAPVRGHEEAFPEAAIRVAGPVLASDINDARGLERARGLSTDEALDMIAESGLRGRGGAYFPVARKWQAALDEHRPIALVVNAEEGEPGVFKDRAILSSRPRRFLEGLAIAAHVLEAEEIVVFINGEAIAARESLDKAISETPAGQFRSPIRIVRGAGGYVLGEETTLLNALEGRKPVPRLRPPYPVESGYFGMPTVVNNVETLANLSVVFRDGPEGFRALGTAEAPGSKIFSVSGNVARPGVYELSLGATIAEVLAAAGGSEPGASQAVLCGGPSGAFLPPGEFDRPLLPGTIHPTGAIIGAGGLVFLDDGVDLRAAILSIAAFNADESCGKCTPCREGSPRALEALGAGQGEGLDELLEVIQVASLCGLGQMATGPIRSARHFWPELFA